MTDELETLTVIMALVETHGVERTARGIAEALVEICGVERAARIVEDELKAAARYDPADDFGRSYDECLRAVPERKANGGPGWPRSRPDR
jgi:hypothetical protein